MKAVVIPRFGPTEVLELVDFEKPTPGPSDISQEFGLRPDAVSGRCSSSPLMVRELQQRIKIPVYNNVVRDLRQLSEILL